MVLYSPVTRIEEKHYNTGLATIRSNTNDHLTCMWVRFEWFDTIANISAVHSFYDGSSTHLQIYVHSHWMKLLLVATKLEMHNNTNLMIKQALRPSISISFCLLYLFLLWHCVSCVLYFHIFVYRAPLKVSIRFKTYNYNQ